VSKELRSALDIALERMGARDGMAAPLTEQQKQAIAEVSRTTKAKIAEVEILFRDRIAKFRAAGDEEKASQAEEQMAAEIARLRAREEEEKAKIRKG